MRRHPHRETTVSVTIELLADSRIRSDDAEVTTRSDAAVAFEVEGTLRLTEALLSQFAGRQLAPTAVAFSVDDAQIVEVALDDETNLRLETVDVGVGTPDEDAIPTDAEDARSLASDARESSDPAPSALAFTVAGVVENVPEEDLAALSADEVVPASVTFSVDETPETDGGAPDDGPFRLRLLGCEIAIREDGTIVVGRRDDSAELL